MHELRLIRAWPSLPRRRGNLAFLEGGAMGLLIRAWPSLPRKRGSLAFLEGGAVGLIRA